MMESGVLPAIVVVTYNRPDAIARILKTIAQANYGDYQDIQLVISVDKSDRTEVSTVAHEFDWAYGPKRVIEQPKNLGLKAHVMACGDLTSEYGEIILLEDDLLVSPEYYRYAVDALCFYADEPEISGISLYSYDFNEYAESRFVPLEDGTDSYFIQTACSWGQAWTAEQWKAFKLWYESCGAFEDQCDRLPQKLLEWSERSWKKFFIKYMILNDKYFAYPRVSLSTNSGVSGANHRGSLNYQVPLQLGKKDYVFGQLATSLAIYDSHYEMEARCLKQLNADLKDVDFECDLYGTRSLKTVKTTHLLSIKTCHRALAEYDLSLIPQELNIVFGLSGDCFSLGKVADFTHVDERKQVAQLQCLHKNLGWKRYAMILKEMLSLKMRH